MNAFIKRSHFSELAQMLCWRPKDNIMTLWAYFDESGWHPTSGKLAKLTVGGCIASCEAWKGRDLDWMAALAEMGIDMFRMSAFAKKDPPQPPFENWTDQQRKDRLNRLPETIGAVKPVCCGFTNLARPGDDTASIYKRCAEDVLLKLGQFEDDFAIVFAYHPEFAAYSPLHQMLMQYGHSKRIKSCTIGYPVDMCPLQAADIVAYEIRCVEREEVRRQRHPLKLLEDLGCSFMVYASAD
jgi:hypothetical protein